MNEARRFGGKLYEAVFQGALQACLLRSIDIVEQQNQGVRLRLRLPPSLIELPWEYLYDPSRQRFLSHSTSTPIVRYLDLQQSVKALSVTPPLKVLVMIASPSDYERLDVEAEWGKIKTAVADLEGRGMVQLSRLPGATLNALQRQLRREPFHIFHFIGHGGFDQQTQDGVLLLESEDGRSRLVSGNYLGTLLHDHPSLRLAVLNACEGARTAKSDPFAGVAQQLVRQGIPAVIAMQFEITDKAALQLAREFYDALADGYPVDGALAEARKAIFTDENDIEWGTPVLYLRATDGRLFDLAAFKPVDVPKPQPEEERPRIAVARSYETPIILPTVPVETTTKPPSDTRNAQQTTKVPIIEPKRHEIAQPQAKKRGWLRIAMILIGVIAVLYAGLVGVNSWQTSVRQSAAATQEAIYASATTQAVAAQSTMTAMAVEVKATVQANAPDMLPLVDRFGMNFVFVPAGPFIMGSPEGQGDADEHPQRTVKLDDFWIGQTEVTNAQYGFFIDAGGYSQEEFWTSEGWKWRSEGNVTQPYYWGDETWNQANYPVVGVSWYEAAAYANWLAKETGLDIRLPSEAQWEKAARGTEGWIYPWGNDETNPQLLNYAGSQLQRTSAVGTYPAGASPYKALDMAGNVWERVADWYDAGYYQNAPNENPPGPTSGDYHVVRGGSWYYDATYVRSSDRFPWFNNDNGYGHVGFRVVRLVSPGN